MHTKNIKRGFLHPSSQEKIQGELSTNCENINIFIFVAKTILLRIHAFIYLFLFIYFFFFLVDNKIICILSRAFFVVFILGLFENLCVIVFTLGVVWAIGVDKRIETKSLSPSPTVNLSEKFHDNTHF